MYISHCFAGDPDDLVYERIKEDEERRAAWRVREGPPAAGPPPEKGEPTDCESVGSAENENNEPDLDSWKSDTKQLEESGFNEQKIRVEDFRVREREKAQTKCRDIILADNLLGAFAKAVADEVDPKEFEVNLRETRRVLAEIEKEEKLRLPPFADASVMLEAAPESEPPQLIQGILHQGLKAELAGASKSMKSWLALQIAVCVATGTLWLERFATTKARVIYLNLEVPRWNFHKRVRQIAEAMGIKFDPDMFLLWNLRGYDLSRDDVWQAATERIIAAGPIGLIIPDPLYKLFNELRSENESAAATVIMKRFDVLAEQTGASPLFTHHFTKGSPIGKESVDRFSGSSILIRDPDVYLCMTRHQEQDAFTIEPTLRCLSPVEPFAIRWEHPIFKLAKDLNPEELRQAPGNKSGRKATYSVDQLVACLGDDENLSEAEFEDKVRQKTGMAHSTFIGYQQTAAAMKLIFKSPIDDTWQRYPNTEKQC
jgi:hypothetical protein